MNLRHEIETNGIAKDRFKIEEIADRIAFNHQSKISVGCNSRDKIRIFATCNGAALRDLVTELDRAGYLE